MSDVKAVDGTTASLRSAKAAGSYVACFKLKDPTTCAWEGESEDATECWVPWSIALQEFDPNSAEITYWGTASNNSTTTVAYTGKPVWVRPWFAPAKAAGGEFPEWLTHWGGKGRPTDDRSSAVVVYLKGDDAAEGLVGYHENADGSFEAVTAEQVYAWMFGVDVDGEHVAVQSGDKVWYKTDENGWKVPVAVQRAGSSKAGLAAQSAGGGDASLAVQSAGGSQLAAQAASGDGAQLAAQAAKPKGAEGYVVARDPAYATHLGVMEPGTYQAFAYFDEGAGFAPTALAETTVKVKAAGGPKATAKTGTTQKSSAAATPKTGDLSPLAMGGTALAALLAAGALALARARRRD